MKKDMNNQRESIAKVQHDIWSHWTAYQFSVCQKNDDGSLTIPADKVERWTRQSKTDYADLTEKERDSDRDQADKVLVGLESGWISVEDRLPSLWQRAWLSYEETAPNSNTPIVHQTEGMLVKWDSWDAHWLHDTNNISIVAKVTHWQPLPSPPNTK